MEISSILWDMKKGLWMKKLKLLTGKFYCIQYFTWSKVKIIAVIIIKPYSLTESIKTQKVDNVLYMEHGDLRNGWKNFE